MIVLSLVMAFMACLNGFSGRKEQFDVDSCKSVVQGKQTRGMRSDA